MGDRKSRLCMSQHSAFVQNTVILITSSPKNEVGMAQVGHQELVWHHNITHGTHMDDTKGFSISTMIWCCKTTTIYWLKLVSDSLLSIIAATTSSPKMRLAWHRLATTRACFRSQHHYSPGFLLKIVGASCGPCKIGCNKIAQIKLVQTYLNTWGHFLAGELKFFTFPDFTWSC